MTQASSAAIDKTAEAMLGEAGFTAVERTVLDHGSMNDWFVSRKT